MKIDPGTCCAPALLSAMLEKTVLTDNRPKPQKMGPSVAEVFDYRSIPRSRKTAAKKEAAHMSDTNEPSGASGGSVAERPLGDPEIAAEILRLRVAELEEAIRRLADQDATLSVCDGNVTVTMDATLTDAERSAIRDAADRYASLTPESAETVATLLGILDRL